jgi:TonB family protein
MQHKLPQRALKAVREWKFEPAKRNGWPVAATVTLVREFRLR